jgi:hypothetical protein
MWSHIIIILSRGVPITCGTILLSFSAEVCPLHVVPYYYHSQFHTSPHYCINNTSFDMWSHIIIILSRGVPIKCGLILFSFSAEVCPLNVVSYFYHSQFHTSPHYMY